MEQLNFKVSKRHWLASPDIEKIYLRVLRVLLQTELSQSAYGFALYK